MPGTFLLQNQGAVLWILAIFLPVFPYGAVTLYRTAFQRTSGRLVRKDTSPNPTALLLLSKDSVCPSPLSLAVTHGIAIAFSSYAY
jgi:hypothetical protein